MSLRPDGTYRCDRCDTALTNGGVHEAAVISTIEDDGQGGTRAVTLHLCREPAKGRPRGCAAHLLTSRSLAAYHETRTP